MSKALNKADILENDIREKYPDILELLLIDRTTGQNIFWATDDYKQLGEDYEYNSPIYPKLITGKNGHVIMPRAEKTKLIQQTRVRDMAEVFTPSWVCNAQNNLIDDAWFGSKQTFNATITGKQGQHSWETNYNKIHFPKNKNWKQYIQDARLEIACGEAPYLVSRYDTTTGIFIPVSNRIGLLDRKLRIVNENTKTTKDWLKYACLAYQNTYAYEWQGDSLLLAREAMLFTFIENYIHKFKRKPALSSIKEIANIISWNVWQMNGLTGTIPNSCNKIKQTYINLLGETETKTPICAGCKTNDTKNHNGVYCIVKDWDNNEGKLRFVELMKQNNF